jgi:hypothetical protein
VAGARRTRGAEDTGEVLAAAGEGAGEHCGFLDGYGEMGLE